MTTFLKLIAIIRLTWRYRRNGWISRKDRRNG